MPARKMRNGRKQWPVSVVRGFAAPVSRRRVISGQTAYNNCAQKSPPSGGKHVCVARGGSEEEEEDGVAFQNGGGIISGSRKRQRIRVAVAMAQNTPQRRRDGEGHNGKMPCNVPGFIITPFFTLEGNSLRNCIETRFTAWEKGGTHSPAAERESNTYSKPRSFGFFSFLPSDSLNR